MNLASAQIKDTLILNEVVVTATRSEKNIEEVSRSITVITSEQIRASGANTLSEVLSSQEGIYIVGTGQTPGSLQSIFMRGANSNQTAIMIDGVRITDPSSTDNSIDLSELSLLDISRIEIVRGSHSTLYGSSAIGGVINIITEKYGVPGVHFTSEMKAGTFGRNTLSLSETGRLNYNHKSGFYADVLLFNNNTKGLNATVDTSITDTYKDKHRDQDGFDKRDIIGRLGYKSEKLNLFASFKNVNQQSNIDKGAFNDDDNYNINFKRNLFTYGGSYKLNKRVSLTFTGGLTALNRKLKDDSSRTDDAGNFDHTFYKGHYKGLNATNELQVNYHSRFINLVAGFALFKERMTFDTYYYSGSFGVYESKQNLDTINSTVTIASQFLHADINGNIAGENFKSVSVGLGLRNSHHSLFGNNITWEFNPSVKLSNSSLLFASWSTGFNAPSLYQLYSPEKNFNSGITRGNQNLKPETSFSFEIGLKQRINNHFSYTISYFKTIVRNSIDYVYLWDKNTPIDSLSYLQYQGDIYLNIGKQTNQGVEISVNSKLNDKISVIANISLINGKLDYRPIDVNSSQTHGNQVQVFSNGAFINKEQNSFGLVRRPSTANLNIIYNFLEGYSIGADLRYVGSRNDVYYNSALGPYGALGTKGMGDYTLVDLCINYKIMKGLTGNFRVANIFNQSYNEIYGYTTAKRGFYFSLRYSI